jgi:hypothetical protein
VTKEACEEAEKLGGAAKSSGESISANQWQYRSLVSAGG